MKNRILIIEDERDIRELLTMNLEAVGYEVIEAADGEDAREKMGEYQNTIDLAITDVMMPGLNGFQVFPYLEQQNIPCIFLTARSDVISKVKGLKMGAEDYIVKPFELMELYARIENVLKRRQKLSDRMELDNCLIDLTRHQVKEDGWEIVLKPMEYDLFVFLCRNQNIAFTRNQLLDNVWGSSYIGETRTVDVHIASLRKKIRAASHIQTIPRLGYRMEV